jgi:hypothetical protein
MYTLDMEYLYESNEEYQSVLLRAFQAENHDVLGDKIAELYTQLKHHETIPSLLNKIMEIYVWASYENAFYLLFSYDYLQYTHPYVVHLLKQEDASLPYNKLLSELK